MRASNLRLQLRKNTISTDMSDVILSSTESTIVVTQQVLMKEARIVLHRAEHSAHIREREELPWYWGFRLLF